MKPQDAYKFCPRCAAQFEKKDGRLLICEKKHHLYLNPCPTASAIIVNSKDEVLLARRGVQPQKGLWDTVGGFVEMEESLEEAVRREVREELGVEIELIDFIGGFSHSAYVYNEVAYPILGLFYTARIISGVPRAMDDIVECKFFKKEEIAIDSLAFEDVRQALQIYFQNRL